MSQPESLVKRLAGPSTGKAGVKQDQEEINKIIYEASKGSKFYENEKRKDKELTEKITKLLQRRDELLKTADIAKLEATIDKLILDLESRRELGQSIVHVDLDSFYASVEVLDDPSLAGKPFGVGHGILSTASYEARKYGVRSAMPGFIAKKLCSELIFVKTHFDRYSEMSKKVMNILRNYDPNMATGGMDEAYLNITQYCSDNNLDSQECVARIRARVFEETKLTISAGIAPNTMLAKVCSDKNKPNGQFHLEPTRQAVMDFTRELPIRKIPGIGRVSERLLDSIGIKTCGDVFTHRAILAVLEPQFHLPFLLRTYLGIGSSTVEPGQREERKSVGVETTFNPIGDEQKILEKLERVAEDLEYDLERTGWAGKTITLKYKLDTYQVFTRAKSASKWITKKSDLFEIGKELLFPEMPLKLRLIGLRATKLKDLRADQNKGIKRFFQGTDSTSPRKKAKISFPEDDLNYEEVQIDDSDDDIDAAGTHSFQSEPQLMPPRWARKPEFAEATSNQVNDREDKSPTTLNSLSVGSGLVTSSKKPLSASKQTVLKPVSVSRAGNKNKAKDPSHQRSAVTENFECPICNSVLRTDNAGFNEHLDWCLSRSEIKKASAG